MTSRKTSLRIRDLPTDEFSDSSSLSIGTGENISQTDTEFSAQDFSEI